MKTRMRLKKLEEVTGINEPCAVCERIDSQMKALETLASELGVKLQEARPPEVERVCPFCLRAEYVKVGELTLKEQDLLERFYAAYEAGEAFCGPNSALKDDAMAALDQHSRAEWGEHYPALRAMITEQRREMETICSRLTPRKMYLCRVPGCKCDFPKTEEEWRELMGKRQAA